MATSLNLFATTPKAMEGLLAEELCASCAAEVHETRAGVSFAARWNGAARVPVVAPGQPRAPAASPLPAPSYDALYEGPAPSPGMIT